MDREKKNRLTSKGWKVGTVSDFLDLTPEEAAYIELRLSLSESVKRLRKSRKVTQNQLAKMLSSSQSRVAKLEAGESSVSIDLLIRSLFVLGGSNKDLARIIAPSEKNPESIGISP